MTTANRISWILLLVAVALVPAVVGFVPFGPQLTLSPFGAPSVVLLCVLVGLAAAAAAVALITGRLTPRIHGLLLALGALVVMLVVASATSLDPAYALFGDGDDLNGLLVYAACALATLLVMVHVSKGARLRTLTSVVIGSGLFVAVIALSQQLLHIDPFSTAPLRELDPSWWMLAQGASTFGNPDFTGNFLVLPTVLAISRALDVTGGRNRVLLRGLTASALLLALVLTLTRGAWLGAGVGALAVFVLALRRSSAPRRLAIVAAAAVLAVLVFAFVSEGPNLVRRVAEVLEGGRHGFGGRSVIWREALAVIRAHPASGVGPAVFRLGWYSVRAASDLFIGANAVATDAHSYPLMLGATAGVPALVAGAAFWIGALLRSAGLVFTRESGVSAEYAGWFAGALGLTAALPLAMMTTPLLMLVFVTPGVLLVPLARPAELTCTSRWMAGTVAVALGLGCIGGGLLQAASHTNGLRALAQSPTALARVAERPPWSGRLGVVAARLEGERALASLQASDGVRAAEMLDAIWRPVAERHPADYDVHLWWAIQLFIAGDTLDDPALLERGLTVSDKALRLYPNSLELRTNRARALLDLGRAHDADKELGALADADPSYTAAADVRHLIDRALAGDQ